MFVSMPNEWPKVKRYISNYLEFDDGNGDTVVYMKSTVYNVWITI